MLLRASLFPSCRRRIPPSRCPSTRYPEYLPVSPTPIIPLPLSPSNPQSHMFARPCPPHLGKAASLGGKLEPSCLRLHTLERLPCWSVPSVIRVAAMPTPLRRMRTQDATKPAAAHKMPQGLPYTKRRKPCQISPGIAPPYERRDARTGSVIQDWRWSVGAIPWGPHAHSYELSHVLRGVSHRNFLISHAELAVRAVQVCHSSKGMCSKPRTSCMHVCRCFVEI